MILKIHRNFLLIAFVLYILVNSAYAQVDTNKVYDMGEIVVKAPYIKKDPARTLSASRIKKMNRITVPDAINLMPGISKTKIGSRNETEVFVRGFDLRQVPLFVDGVPVYVPYDGHVDLGRFTTFSLSQIQVSKGGSSVLYGANTMGGAINLVSEKPKNTLELNGAAGWLSGGQRANISAGSKFGKFYTQVGFSHYKRDHYNLSDNFEPTHVENGGKRENSYNEDNKLSFKLGYVPDERSEYSVSYIRQHGAKGNPIYTGNDTLNSQYNRPRYWKWPHWDKESVYFISRTGMGSDSYLKTRLFYDSFDNELNSYDDSTYTTQQKRYAFTSIYDDYRIGGLVEFGTERFKNHFLKLALHYKKDVHQEYGPEDPKLTMSDYTTSLGVEDAMKITDRISIISGLNWNTRESLKAEKLVNDEISSFPSNKSQAINGQINFSYRLDSIHGELFATVARKTRFATLKDRYSYRLGRALPNPYLDPENTVNYELGVKGKMFPGVNFRSALFYSDIDDVIQRVDNVSYDSDLDTWLEQYKNSGRAAFYGGEGIITYRIFDKLKGRLNYTFIKRKNLSNPDVKFTDVPEHKFFTQLEYNFNGNSWAMLSFEYNSDRYSTTYGTIASEYSLINLKAHTTIWKYISLEGGINNLLDKNYALAEGFPEPGRNYYLTLRFS
ncbi:MAG: TonB-dependent receptor plug domain-containing protein, partial [Bacteroidota bacterium]